MHILKLVAAAGITAAWFATPANARPAWANEATTTDSVQYGDLDLTSAKDQARLKRRINSVAYRLCLEVSGASPAPPPTDPTCFNEAMKDALAQMDRAIARASNGETRAAAKQVNAPH